MWKSFGRRCWASWHPPHPWSCAEALRQTSPPAWRGSSPPQKASSEMLLKCWSPAHFNFGGFSSLPFNRGARGCISKHKQRGCPRSPASRGAGRSPQLPVSLQGFIFLVLCDVRLGEEEKKIKKKATVWNCCKYTGWLPFGEVEGKKKRKMSSLWVVAFSRPNGWRKSRGKRGERAN